MVHVKFISVLEKTIQNNGNSRRSKQQRLFVQKELAVLLTIRCLSVLLGGVWNKHWIIKKRSVCLLFVLFPV